MALSTSTWSSRPRRIVGLMSGTSLDGVDAALIEVRGGIPFDSLRVLGFFTRAYSPDERARILNLLQPQINLPDLLTANVWLGEIFAEAALRVISQAGLMPEEVDAVASHGQTIWHIPPHDGEQGATLQIGEPAVIAERTGLLTVADFRPRDMAAGGQGAPLVPFADYLLFRSEESSVAVQNIGGIANVTYLPRGCRPEDIIAFDTGPGNMIIDAVISLATQGQETYDKDGKHAAKGTVQATLLNELMSNPYFALPPPKSTGRELFGMTFAEGLYCNFHGNLDDLIATVTAFTAESIARAYRDFLLPHGAIDEVILGGGGSYNPTLRAMLAERLPGIPVHTHEDHGLSSEAKEAVAFAILGHATLCGVPANVPSATGAAHPVILGHITPGKPGAELY
ncbi:MAG: anhydro-N-acetylmuramic acid kinase [Armatimonadota bacterium]